jgi:hypothetical protein
VRSGCKYTLTKNGIDFYNSLNSGYAKKTKHSHERPIEACENTDDVKLLALITRINESIEEGRLL